MDWSYLIHELRVVFLQGFTLFSVWSVMRWVRYARAATFTKRDWFGAFAFWIGILLSSLLGYYYAYFWVTNKLVVALIPVSLVSFVTAVGGLLLGLAGRGWVRRAAVFVLVVVAFQWANLVFIPTPEYVVMAVMFATLSAGTLLWYGIHFWVRRGRRGKTVQA